MIKISAPVTDVVMVTGAIVYKKQPVRNYKINWGIRLVRRSLLKELNRKLKMKKRIIRIYLLHNLKE